jgi:hypothetical protein
VRKGAGDCDVDKGAPRTAVTREKLVKRYKTDLSDEEWQAIEPLMPVPA